MTSRTIALFCLALAGFLITAASPSYAQSSIPAWWEDPLTAIIDPEATENNYAPVNLGQLKHVATMAETYLDTVLAAIGGSGSEISSLTSGFDKNMSKNYSPVNIGQVKAVARPFYDRLNNIGYDVVQGLINQGYPVGWSYKFPWDPSTEIAYNYAPSNIGQLKIVFSFDLRALDVFLVDSNNSGIPDWWKFHFFKNINLNPNDYPEDPSDGTFLKLYNEWFAEIYGGDCENKVGLIVFSP